MIPVLILTVGILLPSAAPDKPDSNFKSIHRIQAEEHARDTLKEDTAAAPAPLPDAKTLGYATYFLVIILLLVILTVVYVLLRSRHKIKRE